VVEAEGKVRMALSEVVEQEAAKRSLLRQIEQGRISHAYLFTGPEGVGKTFTAVSTAQALNCSGESPGGCGVCDTCRKVSRFLHPDVRLIFAVPAKVSEEDYRQLLEEKSANPLAELTFAKKSSISIAQVREIKEEINLGLFEGRWKTVIIRNAEDMTLEAANSLLKVLEEPRENTTLILTSSRPQALLPTVRSRCQRVRFFPLSAGAVKRILAKHLGASEAEAELAASFSQGSVTLASRMLSEDISGERGLAIEVFGSPKPRAAAARKLASSKDRALFDRVLRFALGWYRDLLLVRLGERERISNADLLEKLKKQAEESDLREIIKRVAMLERLRSAIELNANPTIAVETVAASWKEPDRLMRSSLFSDGGVDTRWWNW